MTLFSLSPVAVGEPDLVTTTGQPGEAASGAWARRQQAAHR